MMRTMMHDRLPAQLKSPRDIVELFLNIAQAHGSQTLTLEIKNGGLTAVSLRADGAGEYGELLESVIQAVLDGQTLTDYSGANSWKDALICLISGSDCRYGYFNADGRQWISVSTLNGEQPKRVVGRGEAGFELSVINAFLYRPDVYRNLERDYIQTMRIANLVRRFCLENPHIALNMKNNGRGFLCTPGDGSVISCMKRLFPKPILHQLQTSDGTWRNGSFTVYYLPTALQAVEKDIAVVRIGGTAQRDGWILEELRLRYGNDFSGCHFVYIVDLEPTGQFELTRESFAELLSSCAITKLPSTEAAPKQDTQGLCICPPFLSSPRMEQAVLPDVRKPFQVVRVFERFFLIQQDCWTYLIDYMEVLMRLRMMEIRQEYKDGDILTTQCRLELDKQEGWAGLLSERTVQHFAELGFAIEESQHKLLLHSFPYYLKAPIVPSIVASLLHYFAKASSPKQHELLYLIAYDIASYENTNRTSAASENIITLLDMVHKMLRSNLLPRESIPVYRIGFNPYEQRKAERNP